MNAAAPSPTDPPHRHDACWLVWLAGLLAAGFYLLLRRDVVLADDWMLLSLFADREHCAGLDWSQLVADLWTPWLYNDWAYWRPTTTLVMGAWMELLGAPPGRWNLLNPLLHAGNVALFVLLLQRLRLPARAVVLAAAFVLVHPTMVEPLTWFSSLNELVTIAGALLACFGVCRLRARQPRATWLWVTGLWIALSGKENGVVALLVLVAVDRALGPRPLRELVRDHLRRSGPVLAVVIAARAVAGCLDPTGGGEGMDHSVAHFVHSLATKLGLTFGPGVPWSPFVTTSLVATIVVVACLAARPHAAALAAATALPFAYAVLGTHHLVDSDYGGGRMLYPAVFAAALLLALLLAMPRRPFAVGLAVTAMLALLAAAGQALHRRAGQFTSGAAAIERTIAAVRTAYRELPPDGLLSPLLMPIAPSSTFAFLPSLWFPLVEHQVAGPNRMLALTHLATPVFQSQQQYLHALPAHVALELGASLLNVSDDGVPVVLRANVLCDPAGLPAAPLRPDEQGLVRLPATVSPVPIETVVVRAPLVSSVALRWQFAGGGMAPEASHHPATGGQARIQVGDDFLLLSALGTGGVAGLHVDARDAGGAAIPPDQIEVQLLAEPDRLPAVADELAPMLSLAQFERLRAPRVDLAPGARLHFGLLLPSSGSSFEVTPGEAIVIPERFRKHLAWTLRVAPSITVAGWFYEQYDDSTPPRLGRRTMPWRRIVQR